MYTIHIEVNTRYIMYTIHILYTECMREKRAVHVTFSQSMVNREKFPTLGNIPALWVANIWLSVSAFLSGLFDLDQVDQINDLDHNLNERIF